MEDPRTIVHRIGERAARTPTAPAVWGRVGYDWRRLTWALYWSSVRQAAKGLVGLGLEPGAAVVMFGGNRPEWAVAEHGIVAAGGLAAPLPPNLDDAALARRLAALEARIVLVDTVEALVRFDRLDEEQGLGIERLVVLDAVTVHDPRMITLDDLMVDGAAVRDAVVNERLAGRSADAPSVLLPQADGPRPVTDLELVAAAEALAPLDARVVSQLPPDTLAEQALSMALPALGGGPVWFTGGADPRQTLVEAAPTALLGSAATWGALAQAIRERLASDDGVRRRVLRWAASTERVAVAEGRDGLGRRLARRLVLDELREALGVGAVERAWTLEPLDADTLAALASVGVVVRRIP